MKKLLMIVLLVTSFILPASAQIDVQEKIYSMSQGFKNAFVVELSNVEPDDIDKMWRKHLRDYKTRAKKNRKTEEWFADDARIKEMSDNTVDIYSALVQIDEGTRVIVWYDLGGAFLDSDRHGAKANKGEKILYNFALEVKAAQAEEVIEAQADSLEEMEDKLKDLTKEEEDYNKSIADLEEKIKELEQEIRENRNEQADVESEIEAQKRVLRDSKSILEKLKNR